MAPDIRINVEAVDQCRMRVATESGHLREVGDGVAEPHTRGATGTALGDVDGGFGAALGAFRDKVTAEFGAAGSVLDGVNQALGAVILSMQRVEDANSTGLTARPVRT